MNARKVDCVFRFKRAVERRFNLRRRQSELRREQTRLKPNVRARDYLGHDANRDVRSLSFRARDSRDLIELIKRVDVDRKYAVPNRLANLVIGFGYAVEYDLIRTESDLASFEQFAARVHLQIAARAAHRIEHRHIRIGFRGVADFRARVYRLDRASKIARVVRDSTLRKNVERRAMVVAQPQGIDAVNSQMTRVGFKITGDFPGVLRRMVSHSDSRQAIPRLWGR